MSSSYTENLLKKVIKESTSNSWDSAVLEWEVEKVEEDENGKSSCICGKENLRYLFTIKNVNNNNLLYPIGSSCIKKFEREDLNEITSVRERLFKLFHAVEENQFISLTADFFSRKLLNYFYEENVFKANKFNDYTPESDYLFLLDMFNKKNEPTINQKRKIKAIIVTAIKPYLEEQVKDKIIKK